MMNKLTVALLLLATPFAATAADARGCVKGAAVGGVGGHFVGKGHAVAGAAIGCAVGHHRAAKAARAKAAQTPQR